MTADISIRKENENFKHLQDGEERYFKQDRFLLNVTATENKDDQVIKVPDNENSNTIASTWPGYITETFKSLLNGESMIYLLAHNFFNAVLKRRIITEQERKANSCKKSYIDYEDSLHSKFEHDIDVNYGNEVTECQKNACYKKFIPMAEFSLEKLPENYQDADLLETIKLLGELTVQITVNVLGKSKQGSGKVIDVVKNTSAAHCPCGECKQKPKASKTWWKVIILTSSHVVSDKEEAKFAKGRLFFSSEDAALVSVDGVDVIKSSATSEVRRLVCVTCDEGLANGLNSLLDKCTSSYEKTFDKFWDVKKVDKLVVIVSHPHGFPQMVSIGKSGKIVHTGQDVNVLTYTNVSCPGSTGAYLYMI